ncbi:MAG: flagellar hook-basal body complex protein, partial [Nitrospirae bacterium]|nr:flagellar hook-basal body complex protein [Candidatus Troglogloeales bacterium]
TDTTAFKENDILFSELISQFAQVGGARYQTGRGALVDIVRAPFRQGTLEQTGNSLDLAIQGEGFFMLKDPLESPIPLFSRAGAFHVDNKGFLANPDGLQLQGFTVTVDPSGKKTVGAAAGAIDVSKVVSLPKATAKISAALNLFSNEPEATVVNGEIPTDSVAILNDSVSITGIALGAGAAGVDALTTAINTETGSTGVVAEVTDTGFLKLTNLNGGPIVIELNTDPKTGDPDILAKTGLQNGDFQSAGGVVLTGLVTGSTGDVVVTGTGTKFKTELRPGDTITFGEKAYIVQSIESDTELTVTEAIDAAVAGTSEKATGHAAAFSSQVKVFDSLGNDHLVTVSFVKTAPTGEATSEWRWSAIVGTDDNNNNIDSDQVQATGVLTFKSDGLLQDATTVEAFASTGGFDFKGGAALDQAIAFDFLGTKANSSDGATQFGGLSAVLKQTQDGFSSGALQNLSVDSKGFINGLFTNGTTQTLAQVVLATFPNQDGLVRVGGNSYIQSKESGNPLLTAAGTAGIGTITSNALEVSTVDLTKQFVKLITYQRGFQANSRVIVTSDEVIQEIVNLKR